MNKNQTLYVSALVVVLIGVGGVFLQRSSNEERVDAPSASPALPPAIRADSVLATFTTLKLPPVDAPLSQTLPALEVMAAEGHAPAACRIAAEHLRCSQLPAFEQEFDLWLVSRQRALNVIEASGDSANIAAFQASFDQSIRKREARLERVREHCRDYVSPPPLERIAAWRRAALLGDPTAVHQYASGAVFSREDLVSTAPALATYAAEAESMALRLAEAGDLQMTLVLAAAYSPIRTRSSPLLAQVVPPNKARSLAFYRRAEESILGNEDPEALNLMQGISLQKDLLAHGIQGAEQAESERIFQEMSARWIAPPNRVDGVNAFGERSPPRTRDCR